MGVDVATPLEQVAEIVPFPSEITQTEVGAAVLGIMVHRRTAVPLLCLATLLGLPQAPVTPSTCLLLVLAGDTRVAFVVEGLRSIDRLGWHEPRTAEEQAAFDADPAPALERALHAAPLVCVGDDTRLLPHLDLTGLARAVQEELSGVPSLPQPRGASEPAELLTAAEYG